MRDFNFAYPATLSKAGKSSNGKIPITIIPSLPTPDREKDTIALKAFDDDCKEQFLKDGVIDYDHMSYRGQTKLEKAEAIIGEPTDLFIDISIPTCHAFLFEKNPYVCKSILPALEAKSKVFGASVGGRVLKSTQKDPINKSAGQNIFKVRLKHIAICPLQNAVHQGTSVSLRKSINGENKEGTFYFNDFGDLVKSFETDELLEKALTAGSETDISNVTGGQALQTQSLEGSVKKLVPNNKIKIVLPFVLENIKNGSLKGGYDSFKKSLSKKGLSKGEVNKIINLVALNSAKIVNKFKNKI